MSIKTMMIVDTDEFRSLIINNSSFCYLVEIKFATVEILNEYYLLKAKRE